MKSVYMLLLACLLTVNVNSQAPKREIRATWLATVWSLDWPNSKISSTGNEPLINAQKKQMIGILDNLASININAIFFQIRSRCDAMYKSSYEPWSSDLVATRGMDPGYDPLEFVVEEAHKRGIEVHAWMNPYRFSTASNYWDGQAGDYRATNPDWIMTYPVSGSSYYAIMNPGLPAVRQRITDIVEEVVTNYDVDGIVFDDYFYSYSGTPTDLDIEAQRLYRPEGMSLSDWRRRNVNQLIGDVYNMIQGKKPYVRFGVSPFGIWTTNNSVAQKEGIVLPTGITGANTYESIYCDPVAWLKEGTVDYISPQLYWTTYSSGQDFDVLCPWWAELSFGFKKHFYASHSISAVDPSDYTMQMTDDTVVNLENEMVSLENLSSMERAIIMQNQMLDAPQTRFGPEEIGRQIDRNRKSNLDGAPGSVFYSTKYLYNVKGVMPYLKQYWFGEKALVPAIDWKSVPDDTRAVTNITLDNGTLKWDTRDANVRYSVYAIPNSAMSSDDAFNVSTYLQGITYTNQFELDAALDLSNTTLAVAVFDRYGNEYVPTIMASEQGTTEATKLTAPATGTTLIGTFTFKWNAVSAGWYTVEIAEDPQFNTFHSRKVTINNELNTDQIAKFESSKTYYWRVLSHKAGCTDGVSEVRSFIPESFVILSPESGAVDVSLSPEISWRQIPLSNISYRIEVASFNSFANNYLVYSNDLVDAGSVTIPSGILMPLTTYYARVLTTVDNIDIVTETSSFTTKLEYPAIPTITSPVHGSSVTDNSIVIKWAENIYATGFQVHLSKDESFPIRNTTSMSTTAFNYEVDYGDLEHTTYYARVRANYSGGQTEWSPAVSFVYSGATSIFDTDHMEPVMIVGQGVERILRIDSSQIFGDVLVQLYDVTGKLRKTYDVFDLSAGIVEIPMPLTELSKGIYLLKVVYNKQPKVFKLIN